MSYFQKTNPPYKRAQAPAMSKTPSSNRFISFNASQQQITSHQSIDSKRINRPSDNYQQSMRQQQIGHDIAKILRSENLNLKDQNNFLLQKLRSLSTNETESVELQMKQQGILQSLKAQNGQLKREFEYMKQLANSKIQQFGKKLAKIAKDTEHRQQTIESDVDIKELNPLKGLLGLRQIQSQSQKQISEKKSEAQKQSIEENLTSDVGRSLEDLNNQFQAILYSCKVQKDNKKRKEYRRRLVQLTYKMKHMKK